MRHQNKGIGLGRSGGHRKALYRNLVTDLLKHEKITTTEAKAKEIRGMAEKVITMGKKGGLTSYRKALTVLLDEHVAEKVFSDLAKRYEQRPGGYTRITKLGPRLGDATEVVRIELVE